MEFGAGQRIEGRFQLLACLGQGGQGDVWKAEDLLHPGRLVALKRISPPPGHSVHFERARREAHHLAALDHPGLVHCYQLLERPAQNDLLLVMELAEGKALEGLLEDPRLSARHRLELLRHSARALAALHEAGIIHRDLKPANIVVSDRFWQDPGAPDVVKLIDLGIAVEIGNPAPLTQPDRVIGTPPYMAPEIIAPAIFGGRGATPTADVFAWGILAWKLLLGTHPTWLPESASLAEFTAAYLDARGQPAWMPTTLPPHVGALLRDCVQLDPSARIQDAAQILQRLYSPGVPSVAPVRTEDAPTPRPPPAHSFHSEPLPFAQERTVTKDAPRSRPSGSSLATAASLLPPPPRSRASSQAPPGSSRWPLLLALSLLGAAALGLGWLAVTLPGLVARTIPAPQPAATRVVSALAPCPCDTANTSRPCASRRSTSGTLACGENLPAESLWNLRLSYVKLDRGAPGVKHEALQKQDPNARVRVCVLGTTRCQTISIKEAQYDCGRSRRLRVTAGELVQPGLSITVLDQQGAVVWSAESTHRPLGAGALCDGVLFKAHPGDAIAEVGVFLDDP